MKFFISAFLLVLFFGSSSGLILLLACGLVCLGLAEQS